MCGNGLIKMGRTTIAKTTAPTPAAILLDHLGLETKASAEIQDLYSRPIHPTVVIPLITGEHRVLRTPTADAA